MSEGGRKAVRADDEVVPAAEARRLEERVRDLERLLGRKTMEVEILKGEAAKRTHRDLARSKKQSGGPARCSSRSSALQPHPSEGRHRHAGRGPLKRRRTPAWQPGHTRAADPGWGSGACCGDPPHDRHTTDLWLPPDHRAPEATAADWKCDQPQARLPADEEARPAARQAYRSSPSASSRRQGRDPAPNVRPRRSADRRPCGKRIIRLLTDDGARMLWSSPAGTTRSSGSPSPWTATTAR